MRLQDVCVVVYHLLCQRTNSNSSGDVCGAVNKLSTGVKEEESFWLNIGIGLRCRSIMDNSSVRTVSRDCLEGEVEASFLLESQFLQLVSYTDLCQIAICRVILEPLYQMVTATPSLMCACLVLAISVSFLIIFMRATGVSASWSVTPSGMLRYSE